MKEIKEKPEVKVTKGITRRDGNYRNTRSVGNFRNTRSEGN